VANGSESPVFTHCKSHVRTMAMDQRKSKRSANSTQHRGEFGKIGHDEIGLMRRVAERPLAPVDERGPHAIRLRSDTIEGVVCDEQNVGPFLSEDLGGFGVSLPMRLEIAGLLDRDDVIECKADVRPSRLEHVAIAIREDGELVSFGSKLLD